MADLNKTDDWKTLSKQMSRTTLKSYRLRLQAGAEIYVNERTQHIDQIMNDLQQRADRLKEDLHKQKLEVLENFDSFVQEFLSSNKFDYLVKGEGHLNFQEILRFKLLAQSPTDASVPVHELFDLRDELTLQIPKMEISAGVLFYKIAEYADLQSIPLMELFSNRIQNKLQANLSAFQSLLIKKNLTQERLSFTNCKQALLDSLPKKFDTEFALEHFAFQDNDQTAIRKMEQFDWFETVRVQWKSASAKFMRVKFKFSHGGFFGIWFCKYPTKGVPGSQDSNGLMVSTDGLWNQAQNYIDTGLGDLSCGKGIEMTYDRRAKSLKINFEDKSYSLNDQNWPTEVYFAFSLYVPGHDVRIISN